MGTTKEETCTKVGKYKGGKGHDCHDCCSAAPPSNRQALVKEGGIKKPGNQGPCLFWIPAPVRPPGLFGPDGTRNDAQGEERKTYLKASFVHDVKGIKGGQSLEDPSESLFLDLPFLEEIHN